MLAIVMLQVTTSIAGDKTYVYKNYFKFELPNKLEIKFDENIDASCIIINEDIAYIKKTYGSERAVWCQKGLNSPKSKDVFDTYCRVITLVENCEPGEVPERNQDFIMDEDTWEAFFDAAKVDCESTGQKIIKWLGFNKIIFNGYPGVYVCYLRSGWKNAPPVIVYKYTIFDGDKICHLIFSYRESEADLWSDIKNTIARTFTFDIETAPEDKDFDTNLNHKKVSNNAPLSFFIIGFFVVLLVIVLIFACCYKKEKKV